MWQRGVGRSGFVLYEKRTVQHYKVPINDFSTHSVFCFFFFLRYTITNPSTFFQLLF